MHSQDHKNIGVGWIVVGFLSLCAALWVSVGFGWAALTFGLAVMVVGVHEYRREDR